MAASTTLNARNLERLGAPALAALLVEVSTGHAAIKRRLRLALADVAGPDEIAAQVRKRIATIGKARGTLDWRQTRALADDLKIQLTAIAGPLAASDPVAAHDLMWTLLALANGLFERTDDGAGRLMTLFEEAVAGLGPLAQAAKVAPAVLAERVHDVLTEEHVGHYDGLVAALAPVLGQAGLDRLKTLTAAWGQRAAEPGEEGPVIGYGRNGPVYGRSGMARRSEKARRILETIADQQGDVDAYLALQPAAARNEPATAVAIAQRLLTAGRAEEAWATIAAIAPGRLVHLPHRADGVRLDILEALGRTAEAQAFRWQQFEGTLHAGHLRDHLRRLPDFEDFEAEQRALTMVEGYRDVHAALAFLIEWPAPDRAARMVLARRAALDGDRYEVLGEAADRLDAVHPLAATLLRRAMIDFTLRKARSSRYGHAARHLAECAAADVRIVDHGTEPDHAAYVAALRRDHGRKYGFWQAADA